MPSPAARLKSFIDEFAPEHRRIIRGTRAAMRKRLPGAVEMVYDNYNFLVIGYSATDRASDAVFSIAAAANGVRLFFLDGAKLPDPAGVLEGGGKRVRSVRVPDPSVLTRPAVRRLIAAAAANARVPFVRGARGTLIIKQAMKNHHPRRRAGVAGAGR